MILDTNAVSAVADDDPAAARLFQDARSIELPSIVLGEYRFGIAQSRRRKEYEKWLEELIAATRVLSVLSGDGRPLLFDPLGAQEGR